ncbi:hypothetical protein KPP03845_101010 [Streptomyces xanthophaeus]|nr:hypothetical protein KPP03845_101010 [Streptomyces xanthophaeus]
MVCRLLRRCTGLRGVPCGAWPWGGCPSAASLHGAPPRTPRLKRRRGCFWPRCSGGLCVGGRGAVPLRGTSSARALSPVDKWRPGLRARPAGAPRSVPTPIGHGFASRAWACGVGARRRVPAGRARNLGKLSQHGLSARAEETLRRDPAPHTTPRPRPVPASTSNAQPEQNPAPPGGPPGRSLGEFEARGPGRSPVATAPQTGHHLIAEPRSNGPARDRVRPRGPPPRSGPPKTSASPAVPPPAPPAHGGRPWRRTPTGGAWPRRP